jgi:plastocyanin
LALAACSQQEQSPPTPPHALSDEDTSATPASAPAAIAGHQVEIHDFRFSPTEIRIAPGDAVTWSNRDDEPHNIVANDNSFRSRPLDTGDQFTQVFPTAGEFPYYCRLHPHMTGKVIVAAQDGRR